LIKERKVRFSFIGGGAATFFCCNNINTILSKDSCVIIEQSLNILSKVKVSGGGRCNITTSITDPKSLIVNYPRGGRELLGPFYKFGPSETYDWFENYGLNLKTEKDGRVFPVSNNSQDVIDLLVRNTLARNISIETSHKVLDFYPEKDGWKITTNKGMIHSDYIFFGTGSSNFIWEKLRKLSIDIVNSVPSLFSFKIPQSPFKGIEGISVNHVVVTILGTDIQQNGPILITHEGLSGPAILKSSAFGARILAEKSYQFDIEINWLPEYSEIEIKKMIQENGKKSLKNSFSLLPSRLFERLIEISGVNGEKRCAELSKFEISVLITWLTKYKCSISGKSTNKEEFVTSGGIALHEVDFKNFTLRKFPNAYCAGEVLDIDAVTGGFNFQACWTGGYIAAQDINKKLENL
jgi:predicted Rossmann fold flavoprotein